MKQADLDHFRRRLLASRTELLREIDANPAVPRDVSLGDGDQTDQASAETDRDIATISRERARMLLHRVDQALVRIDNGSYGLCEDTGEPIDRKRLEAEPTATLSLAAQQRRERARS